MIYRILSIIGLLVASCTTLAAQADIWQQLAGGGYVLLMRHGAVDNLSKSTSPDADFEGCEGQYNLNELGRAQALLWGELVRKRKVPIGGVLTSPMCRTQDTARIAFGQFRAWASLEPLPDAEEPERTKRIADISRLIAQYSGRENLVLVTHQPNIDAIALEVVEPGTVVILQPDPHTGFRVIRVLRPQDWLHR